MTETIETLGGLPTAEQLQKINRMSRRILKAEEVFVFSVVLCDNEVDRDNERFSIDALKTLSDLYVGKTGIFDHSMHGRDQCARIFDCEVVANGNKTTSAGETYHYLKAMAYMPRTESNRDLMLEIDAGIKKEVSVGCATAGRSCSICGTDLRKGACGHRLGRYYNKDGARVKCHAVLTDVTDAYEWSFVAVPAQRAAGVTKAFHVWSSTDVDEVIKSLRSGDLSVSAADGAQLADMLSELQNRAEDGAIYRDELRKEAVRLTLLSQPVIDAETAQLIVERMSVTQLKSYNKACLKAAAAELPLCPQLASEKKVRDISADQNYRI